MSRIAATKRLDRSAELFGGGGGGCRHKNLNLKKKNFFTGNAGSFTDFTDPVLGFR